jgi:hypothetical protein
MGYAHGKIMPPELRKDSRLKASFPNNSRKDSRLRASFPLLFYLFAIP